MTWTGFKNFIDEVIYPLTKWTIEEALPKYFDTLSGVLEIFTTVLEKLSPIVKTWWEEYVKPITSFTADKFIEFWEKLNIKLEEAKKWLEETTIFEDFVQLILYVSVYGANTA